MFTVKTALPVTGTVTVLLPSLPASTKSPSPVSPTVRFTTNGAAGAGTALTLNPAPLPSVTVALSPAILTTGRLSAVTVTATTGSPLSVVGYADVPTLTTWLMLALSLAAPTPVTVTLFAVDQSLSLKLTAPPTVTWLSSLTVGVTVTGPPGALSNRNP